MGGRDDPGRRPEGAAGLTPRQVCNVVYHLLTAQADEDGIKEIDAALAEPIDPRDAEAQRRVQATLSNLGRLR